MVRVTAQAATALEELLTESAAPSEAGVRLTPAAGGKLGMAIEAPLADSAKIGGDDPIVGLCELRRKEPVLLSDVADARHHWYWKPAHVTRRSS